jgi:5-methylcytosine-specific restriction protein B
VARFVDPGSKRVKIDALVDEWKTQCLLESGSLIFGDERQLWTPANLQDFQERLIVNPLLGADQSFGQKLAAQLETAEEDVRWLVVELVAVYLLFVREAISPGAKRTMLKSIGAPLGQEMPQGWQRIADAMDEGIGNPGPGYNLARNLQLGYLMDFCLRFKAIPDPDEQRALLDDPWQMRDFADDVSQGVPVREMRHILVHLLFPEFFERISSGNHKRVITDAFAKEFLTGDSVPEDLDEQLYLIRQKLTGAGALPAAGDLMLDFYRPPLQTIWDWRSSQQEGATDIDLLTYKKQMVIFGAPGTGKTHRTRQLAGQMIRRAALQKWGAAKFFSEQTELDTQVRKNVQWLQLHAGYGYEEFIRGLRLGPDGSTTYVAGFLPRLVAAMNAVPEADRLPVVLVLDEINRADLSRMFGEAFSLLENRDAVVTLPGINGGSGDDAEPATLALPPDLFVIGTMNLIDQSVEELDFALRRRFFWRPAEFEPDAIVSVNEQRWPAHIPKKWSWDRAVGDMTTLAERATLLNQAITESPHLGPQYELGHTYYFDTAFFVGNWLRGRKALTGGVLWSKSQKPQRGLLDLWKYSLEPLLMQYLGGLDADVAASELDRLRTVLFSGTLI